MPAGEAGRDGDHVVRCAPGATGPSRDRLSPVAGPAPPDARYKELADAIEAELRRIQVWNESPAPFDRIAAGGAFGGGSVPFPEWVQVVLLARLREVAAGTIEAPARSQVGVYAVRELSGLPEYEPLIDLLVAVDRLAENREG